MDNDNKHTARLALLLAFLVVMLVIVSVDQFRLGGDNNQEASVLRVYAD